MSKIKPKLFHIKELIRERNLKIIFTNPKNIFYFVILILRSAFLRLVPQITRMYFIKKDYKENPFEVITSDYKFCVISTFSEQLHDFIITRCNEDPNFIYKNYSRTIESRINDGMKAFALTDKGVVVSIFFTTNRNFFIEQLNYTYKPESNEIAIVDIYTLLSYRRNGLYISLLSQTFNFYSSEGIFTFIMWIMKHNRATINAQLRAGFSNIFKTVSLLSWMGLNKQFINTKEKALKAL